MLSARKIFNEIRECDESFQLFCSIAAKGEAQGGWENDIVARLTRDPDLAAKIARHGDDEEKHGRLFTALLKKRSLEPIRVPRETDYCALLEARSIGLSHRRLGHKTPLEDEEIVTYLVHSRVTEQRAAEEIALQLRVFENDPTLGKAFRLIAHDEARHLAYCHEELLRFSGLGYGEQIRRSLHRCAHGEIRVYRDVSLAVARRMGGILGWSPVKRATIRAGIHAAYAWERALGWRRLVRLAPPAIANAMGPEGRSS